MLLTLLDEADRALLEEMYDGLGQGERDRLLQETVRILRERGWRRSELAGEDLERMMQELLLQRSFGPERLRKYRERGSTRRRAGTSAGGILPRKARRPRRGTPQSFLRKRKRWRKKSIQPKAIWKPQCSSASVLSARTSNRRQRSGWISRI